MDLWAQFDGYCERTDLTFWSEPLNALTNAAFLIAALVMWQRTRGADLPIASLLCLILAAIGIGSFLFHTFATGWAALADVIPIGLFILLYLFAVGRDFLGLPVWVAAILALAFGPYAYLMLPLLDSLPFFRISDFYWTVPILLVAFIPFVMRTNLTTAQGMLIGAAVLCASITLRSVDEPLCAQFRIGTHIFWHALNAVMLGWMIEVYRRHMLAGETARV
ncbi:MAG: hypothetical protein AAF330_00540 [Pseudomonadota bacterium]